ncbi:DUF4377 domain-containing protein [Zophobihabitans entericus]|uniref:DUF4377 domain-containing protein n=1 Tax=Zophobihabitans entericus TaxID=1635327 RepID=A0A6G9IDR9_9GAMM|nr:DUF4377 domain-containing protein [Zophobihabitans entericus]QIQ21962.1 DUF4377 domain-containing protein [Zophobihabitans entericus]
MKRLLLTTSVVALLLVGCDKNDVPPAPVATPESQTQGTVKEIEVGPKLVDCVGVAPMQCMLVRENGADEWQLYYSSIDGFDYEPGYTYKLKIDEKNIDPANTPADASSIRWKLIEVLGKAGESE